jgi:hypothetical protein
LVLSTVFLLILVLSIFCAMLEIGNYLKLID